MLFCIQIVAGEKNKTYSPHSPIRNDFISQYGTNSDVPVWMNDTAINNAIDLIGREWLTSQKEHWYVVILPKFPGRMV